VLELEEGLSCSERLFSGLAHRHEQIPLLEVNNIAQMMGACQFFYWKAKQFEIQYFYPLFILSVF